MGTLTDVMVDIETTGLSPDANGMIQLAAAKFNIVTGEVGEELFDRCLVVPEGRSWDPDTRLWWSKMPEILNRIEAHAEPVETVLYDFQVYAGSSGPLRFWSKPLSFDYPFVQSYYRQFGMAMPFHYRFSRDMNTYMAALLGGGAEHNPVNVPFVGPKHNAIFDVLDQIKTLFAARKEAGL